MPGHASPCGVVQRRQFGSSKGQNTRLVRFWGARVDARAPRASVCQVRVSERARVHERRKVGAGAGEGRGSPRLLVWCTDACFGRPRGKIHAWCGFCGARGDAGAPRASVCQVRVSCAHEFTNAGRGGAGAGEGRGSPCGVVQRRQFGRNTRLVRVLWGACRRPSTARIRLSGESFCAHERTNATWNREIRRGCAPRAEGRSTAFWVCPRWEGWILLGGHRGDLGQGV